MATKLNIIADQGADYTLDISVKDTDGTATDLTSYTVNENFKKSYSTSQTHNFTTQVTDASAGTIKLTLPAETSSNVSYGKYVYDMVIDSTSLDTTRRVQEGILTIRPNVSSKP